MSRAINRCGAVFVAIAMVGAWLSVAVSSAAPAGAASSTTFVVGNGDLAPNGPWAPEAANANTGTYGFVTGPGTPPGGVGSLHMAMLSGQHEWIVTYGYGICANGPGCTAVGTPLNTITSLGYSTYRTSGGQMPTLNIEVSPSGLNNDYDTFVYVPDSGAYLNGTWQTWNPFGDTTARWHSSASNVAGGVFNCVSQAAGCYATWSQITGSYTNARVLYGLGPNIGTGGTFDGSVDNVKVGVSSDDATYNFEPDCTTTCYVDGTGNDNNTGLSGDPLKTIQAGVNKVNAGGTVHVAAGTYVENVTVTKAVDLAGAGQASTIVEPAVSGPNPPSCGSLCAGASSVFLVQANNVTIHDLKIDGDNPSLSGAAVGGSDVDARNGIITDHTVGVFNNLSVHDVTVKNVFLRGLYASSGGSFTFANNTIDNVQGNASSIAIFNFGGSGTMSGNHVSNAGDAISANHSTGTQFLNNVVTASNSGVHTDNNGDSGGTADVLSGNNVSACTPGGYGVWVFVPYFAPTITGNTVTGCNVAFAVLASCAISGVGNCPGSVVPNVTFTGNSASGGAGDTGLYVTTNSFGYGDGDTHVSADHNTLSGFDEGTYVEESGTALATVTLTRNSLAGNTAHGLNNAGTTSVAATCNWWGSASGPSGAGPGSGSAVTAGATFGPWLVSSNLNGSCTGNTVSIPTATDTVEGNSGYHNVTVQVQLNTVAVAPVTVAWTTMDGTALTPKDYKAANGTVVIPAGMSAGTITVAVKGDKTLEHYETFFVQLTSATNATLGNASDTVTILNDDLPSLKLSKPAATIEGNPVTATATVAFEYYQPIVLNYSTADLSAQSPGDYTGISGQLTIPAGTVGYSHGFSIATHVDGVPEPSEKFQLSITSSGIKRSPIGQSATIKANTT